MTVFSASDLAAGPFLRCLRPAQEFDDGHVGGSGSFAQLRGVARRKRHSAAAMLLTKHHDLSAVRKNTGLLWKIFQLGRQSHCFGWGETSERCFPGKDGVQRVSLFCF